MKPRFLLDEHVNRAIQRQLRRLDSQIEVLAIGDLEAPPTGTLDPEILVWLESHGYLLITANRSTMPGHFAVHLEAGHHIPGIIWLRPGTSLGRIILGSSPYQGCSSPGQYPRGVISNLGGFNGRGIPRRVAIHSTVAWLVELCRPRIYRE